MFGKEEQAERVCCHPTVLAHCGQYLLHRIKLKNQVTPRPQTIIRTIKIFGDLTDTWTESIKILSVDDYEDWNNCALAENDDKYNNKNTPGANISSYCFP